MAKDNYLIGVVGPCAAGKTTLVAGLAKHGYQARHIAQEHSYAPTMWKRITNPQILIYLDVSFDVSLQRRPQNWNQDEFEEQGRRLQNARDRADFYLHTDEFTPEQVLEKVVSYIRNYSR